MSEKSSASLPVGASSVSPGSSGITTSWLGAGTVAVTRAAAYSERPRNAPPKAAALQGHYVVRYPSANTYVEEVAASL